MHSKCADPCGFPKCGKVDCLICDSGELFPTKKKGGKIHTYIHTHTHTHTHTHRGVQWRGGLLRKKPFHIHALPRLHPLSMLALICQTCSFIWEETERHERGPLKSSRVEEYGPLEPCMSQGSFPPACVCNVSVACISGLL